MRRRARLIGIVLLVVLSLPREPDAQSEAIVEVRLSSTGKGVSPPPEIAARLRGLAEALLASCWSDVPESENTVAHWNEVVSHSYLRVVYQHPALRIFEPRTWRFRVGELLVALGGWPDVYLRDGTAVMGLSKCEPDVSARVACDDYVISELSEGLKAQICVEEFLKVDTNRH